MLSGSAIALTGGAYGSGVYGSGDGDGGEAPRRDDYAVPHDAVVVANRVRRVGVLLPSAAGVLCAACVRARIANNTVRSSLQ